MTNLNSKLKAEYVTLVSGYQTNLGTANTWTYIKKSFTLASGYYHIVTVTQGYSSGRPLGIGVANVSDSAMPSHCNTTTISNAGRFTLLLPTDTYYMYTYRTAKPSSNNAYNAMEIRFKV